MYQCYYTAMLFNLPRLAAFALLLSPAFVFCLDTVQFANLLKTKISPGANVYFPSDSNYSSEVTLRSSTFDQPTYYATVQPAIASDVQTIVSIIPVQVKGANSSYVLVG